MYKVFPGMSFSMEDDLKEIIVCSTMYINPTPNAIRAPIR
jgi:hypothetical protein